MFDGENRTLKVVETAKIEHFRENGAYWWRHNDVIDRYQNFFIDFMANDKVQTNSVWSQNVNIHPIYAWNAVHKMGVFLDENHEKSRFWSRDISGLQGSNNKSLGIFWKLRQLSFDICPANRPLLTLKGAKLPLK